VDKIKRKILGSGSTGILVLCLCMLCGRSYGSLEGNGGYDAPYVSGGFYSGLVRFFHRGSVNPAALYPWVNQLRVEAGFYRWNVRGGPEQQVAGIPGFSVFDSASV